MQTQELQQVDAWIKNLQSQISNIDDHHEAIEENIGNIQHNYELIYDLKDDIKAGDLKIQRLSCAGLLMNKELEKTWGIINGQQEQINNIITILKSLVKKVYLT